MTDHFLHTAFGLGRLELAARLRAIADDIEKSSSRLASDVHVVIDQWALARRAVPCLIGRPEGHPTLRNGRASMTSELFYFDEEQGLARSFSRWYRLKARVEPKYWNQIFSDRTGGGGSGSS